LDGRAQVTITPESLSKTREGPPEKLRRKLEGDLDNIVLKAMRKEPLRRYSSVEQFSEDIRRHLEGLPVIARQDTFRYRAGKFITRNRASVIAAALIVMVLLAGMGTTLWQARVARAQRAKAERRFTDVRKLVNSFMFEFHDSIVDIPGTTKARELLVKRALEYLDSLAQEAGNDPSLQRELATAYDRVGDIQGLAGQANLGDTTGALESYHKALAIRQALIASDPTNTQALYDMANSYSNIAYMQGLAGDADGHLRGLQLALGFASKAAAQEPGQDKYLLLASLHFDTGQALQVIGDKKAALDSYFKALAALDPLPEPDVARRRASAAIYVEIGRALAATGDTSGAVDSFHKGLAFSEALLAADPANAQDRRILAASYHTFAQMLADAGDASGALETQRKGLAICKTMVATLTPVSGWRYHTRLLAACWK